MNQLVANTLKANRGKDGGCLGVEETLITRAPFLCGGCNVRPPWEHRCHGPACWCDTCEGKSCECQECADPVVARALTSHADRQDGTVDTFVTSALKATAGRSGASSYEPSDYVVVVEEPYTFDWQVQGSERTWIHDTPAHSRSLTKSKTLAVHIAAPLTSGGHPNSNAPGRRKEDDENLVTAFHLTQDPITDQDVSLPLGAQSGGNGVPVPSAVRRLTPTECERLQGLPDSWTDLGGTADSSRYSALGDAVTANVAHYIGDRIRGG